MRDLSSLSPASPDDASCAGIETRWIFSFLTQFSPEILEKLQRRKPLNLN